MKTRKQWSIHFSKFWLKGKSLTPQELLTQQIYSMIHGVLRQSQTQPDKFVWVNHIGHQNMKQWFGMLVICLMALQNQRMLTTSDHSLSVILLMWMLQSMEMKKCGLSTLMPIMSLEVGIFTTMDSDGQTTDSKRMVPWKQDSTSTGISIQLI